jgi:hypothetical protein
MTDLNKTPLTHEVTKGAVDWLTGSGFKPVQTEVKLAQGWVADVAGAIIPTRTELIDLKLIRRAPKWRGDNVTEQVAWSAHSKAMELPYTCLVEVKTSRADFARDQKWDLTQPANLAYLAVPKGLISEDEWPAGWGILEFNDGAIRCVQPAALKAVSAELQRDVILEIAMRLHNNTDPDVIQLRETMKDQGDRIKAQRLSDIISGVCSIVESKRTDFDLALALTKLPTKKLSHCEKERLKLLFGLGKHVYDELEGKRREQPKSSQLCGQG